MSDGPADHPPPPDRPRIIRRHPTGAFRRLDPAGHPDPQTSYIRPEPQTNLIGTGPEPQTNLIGAAAEPPTSFIPQAPAEPPTSLIPQAPAVSPPAVTPPAGPGMAVATAVVTILSGWATAVIATDLITGWWQTDRLFCVAVGFLTAVSAAAMIGGLILVLLRRRLGRLLIVVGAVIGLLIFGSLFVAGAALPPVVYAIPALPLASVLLTAHPATGRWAHLR